MKINVIFLLCILITAGHNKVVAEDYTCDTTRSLNLSLWAFDVLNLPQQKIQIDREIVLAVIDDGFLLSHHALKGYIFENKGEIPGNGVDDDKNGYIDDYNGWDVSDNDNNVGINPSNVSAYYHGTFISSLITQMASRCIDDEGNSKKIKILPIKVLADGSKTTAITEGYTGIKYAIEMGADIICTAWSGGTPNEEENAIINEALQNNILIIGSAGNTRQKTPDFPSSVTGIFAIAALDTLLRKTHDSNYGMKIDLSLPGEHVRAAHPIAPNAWFYGRGTSAAAGLAAGCAAILKAMAPDAPPSEIMEALKNTATPIDQLNNTYCGKLGSGLPDVSEAIKFLHDPEFRTASFDPERPEGNIYINLKNTKCEWEIHPWGAYESVTVIPDKINKRDGKKHIELANRDSVYFKGKLHEMANGITVPGSTVGIRFESNKRKDKPNTLKLNYFVETIDSSTLYCSETMFIEAEKGYVADNSGANKYANNCACKWIITAPESQRIKIDFLAFDTQAKVDFVWLFDQNSTHPENIIAKFSGSAIPPSITSRTNTITVWFVTDDTQTGKGWKLQFEGQ